MLEQLGGVFWLCVAVFAAYEGWKSDIGTVTVPGPGFLPFWTGVLLGIISLALIISTIVKKEMQGKLTNPWKGLNWGKTIGVSVSLIIYSLVFTIFGYIVTTFGLIFIAVGVMDRGHLVRRGITALAIAVVSYLVFNTFLDARLPKGIFGF
jgi:putative tricarboxylic transport membrane protein